MIIAKIIGTTVSTVKNEKLQGSKLLICREANEKGEAIGIPYVAVDTVNAGVGELVLTAHGSSGRQTHMTKDAPVDAVIMAVIDSLQVDGAEVYRKS
jgi:microcompartment protein CcmK/EutM